MENESFNKKAGNVLGIISLVIALILLLPILNWFFEITSYQKLEGLPLLIAPFISLFGFVFGVLSIKVSPNNKFGKYGSVCNAILFISPFLYWFLGTLIFGP